MAEAFIFAGPTLSPDVAARHLGFALSGNEIMMPDGHKLTFLPPVAEGDMTALVNKNPALIAIIDGYFENIPAIWHKEILYAMAKGVHVMGSSSMGALRAAELHTFGMQGIGHIFKAYADGRWTDDDEVTVAHGPAELGFPAVSDAMANIRATLDDALSTNAITLCEWSTLTAIAKSAFYKNRSFQSMLSTATASGFCPDRAAQIALWLEKSRRDQKQLDALELVDAVVAHLQAQTGPKKVLYNFAETIIWREARSMPQTA